MSPGGREQGLISVVTAVRDGERYLEVSMQSVLAQRDVALEVVVVDDGSRDATPAILQQLARSDIRLRVITQEHRGLTAALIRGADEARGVYLARHDSDDLSLSGRLSLQRTLLESDDRVAFVSCWAQAIGPEGETLFEVTRPENGTDATESLRSGIHGPAGHGSVMMRSDCYRRVGGYRQAFGLAQDWDLWLRLSEVGRLAYVPQILYCYRVGELSISATRRNQQRALVHLAQRCRAARQGGNSETSLLEEAARVSASINDGARPRRNAYFIGKCLLDRRDHRARFYLRRAVRDHPWNWRAWAAWLAAEIVCRQPD